MTVKQLTVLITPQIKKDKGTKDDLLGEICCTVTGGVGLGYHSFPYTTLLSVSGKQTGSKKKGKTEKIHNYNGHIYTLGTVVLK